MSIPDYLLQAFKSSLLILGGGVLPLLAAAFVMQIIANILRKLLRTRLGDGYVYLTAPGVMLHELGHAFFCLVFRHKIIEMKLFAPDDNGTLGYVLHTYNPNSLYQKIGNFFIGTGPVWGGLAALVLLSRLLLPSAMLEGNSAMEQIQHFFSGLATLAFWKSRQSWLWIYLSLTIVSHITLSTPDLKGAGDGFIMIVLTVLLVNLLFGWCGNWAEHVWHYELALLSRCSTLMITILILNAVCILPGMALAMILPRATR